MRAFIWILPLLLTALLQAQEIESVVSAPVLETAEAIAVELESVSVPVEMINQSWFTDRTGTALIHFDSVVQSPESLPDRVSGLSIISIDVRETPDSEFGKTVAIVRFILRDTGVVTFPSLEFSSETKRYQTIPQQIRVGRVVRSEAMSVKLRPAKRQVYAGEPLRVDLTWQCELEASRLQALNYYPTFFNDSAVEIVIPRSTEPEAQQVGLPIGGRRVIAKRTLIEGNPKALGSVTLPLYLRLTEPGVYTLPATRLECAYLNKGSRNFGQYAAHFNNSLFASEEAEALYERIYVETAPIEITVLALPEEGRSPDFSGLFAPVHVDVAVSPDTSSQVGTILQAKLQVVADAPHGMIELPQLSRQRGLRGRFLVDDDLSRAWHAGGTTFRCRLRALTTGVDAFPSLHIQTFDPATGTYVMFVTEPIALSVAPQEDGQKFINLTSYKGTGVTLSNQSEGIWHNRKANRMNDLINTIVVGLASWFWLWLLLGFAGFLLLLPIVRECRRRALDGEYRARMEAYAAFRKLPESDPAKWSAFLEFLAVSFGAQGKAWTVRDSEEALPAIGVSNEDVESILALHRGADEEAYSVQRPAAQLGALNRVGKRILGLLGKTALLLLLGMSSLPQMAKASDWSAAEQLFDLALAAQPGSDAAAALYAESALKFQATAEVGERPGMAWYNAGNAWFKTGALGRSIVAYRQARLYRPFDSMLVENLNAARALALNDVPDHSTWRLPTLWLKAIVLILCAILAAAILLQLRYQRREWSITCLVVCVLCGLTSALWYWSAQLSGRQGVVIVESVLARKGPNYAYASAFHEPLHDGVELTVQETRKEWGLVSLADGRECWVPLSQVQLID